MSIIGSLLTPILPPLDSSGGGGDTGAFVPPDAGQSGGSVVTDSGGGVSSDSSDSQDPPPGSADPAASAPQATQPPKSSPPAAAPPPATSRLPSSTGEPAPAAGQFRAIEHNGNILIEVSNGDLVELSPEDLEANPELRRLLFEKKVMQGSILLDLKALIQATPSTRTSQTPSSEPTSYLLERSIIEKIAEFDVLA